MYPFGQAVTQDAFNSIKKYMEPKLLFTTKKSAIQSCSQKRKDGFHSINYSDLINGSIIVTTTGHIHQMKRLLVT